MGHGTLGGIAARVQLVSVMFLPDKNHCGRSVQAMSLGTDVMAFGEWHIQAPSASGAGALQHEAAWPAAS